MFVCDFVGWVMLSVLYVCVCVSKVEKPFVCEFVGWVMLSVLYVGVCVCVCLR